MASMAFQPSNIEPFGEETCMHTYNNFIAVDWAQSNMAIAHLGQKSKEAVVIDVPADVKELKNYLKLKRGKTILTIEETTTSQWLYVELKDCVDEILICDPYRNKLLSEGAKNDKIDASKLAKLLRGGFLKPVFHTCNQLVELRKIISSYDDLVQRGVRLKNQKSAVLRSLGKSKEETVSGGVEEFIIEQIDGAILAYEKDKKIYEKEFSKHMKKSKMLRQLKAIPGIGTIGAVKIGAIVVDAKRFGYKNKFLSYSGLVRLQRESGGRNYGSKSPRYCRQLKAVFKTAALATIRGTGNFAKLYQYLIEEKRYSDHQARHAIARKIAIAAFGVMYTGENFNPKKIGALKALIEKA